MRLNVLKAFIKFWYPDAEDIRIHTQEDTILKRTDWGIGWKAEGRKFFFFRDYMGWHNLSEKHRADQCDDPAYCQWHGSL